MANSLLSQIVARLDRSGVPNARFPDGKGEYWAHCPYHKDEHATNFSVSEKSYSCFACGEKGGLRSLAEKLGVPPPAGHGGPSKPRTPAVPSQPAAPSVPSEQGTDYRLHGCTVAGGIAATQ